MSERALPCRCGSVVLTVVDAPILTAECLCASCRTAAEVFEALPGAQPVRTATDGSHYVLYRKDRVRCERGAEHLREHKVTPDSHTRRVVATCCNTPVFLDFGSGHWLSVYGNLWPATERPPIQLRTMASDLPDRGASLPQDVKNARTQSPWFMGKLFGAWVAMGFRVPPVGYVNGQLDA